MKCDYINEINLAINTSFKYITISFNISFFNIEAGWIPYINMLLSGLLFYLGIRLIKNINNIFKYTYYSAFLFLIINMIDLAFYAPLFIITIFVGIIRIFLMVYGFKRLLNDNYHVNRFLLIY